MIWYSLDDEGRLSWGGSPELEDAFWYGLRMRSFKQCVSMLSVGLLVWGEFK